MRAPDAKVLARKRALPFDLKSAKAAEIRHRYTLDDTGFAKLLVYHHGRYVRALNALEWRDFDGTCFQSRGAHARVGQRFMNIVEILTEKVAEEAVEVAKAEAALGEAAKEDPRIQNWREANHAMAKAVAQRRSLPGRRAAVALALEEPSVYATTADFNRQPHLFPMANGTFDFRLFVSTADAASCFRQSQPEDMLTGASPVVYDPKAQAPKFQKYLREVQPKQENREALQRISGTCLVGDVTDVPAILHIGTGDNGKSIFWRMQMAVLGEDLACVTGNTFLSDNYNEPHPTTVALARWEAPCRCA